ncbi:MAG: general secretion pathway protein GspK [Nitrospirae bacterium]|nr:general secretion pathway protein GspK [Nitrospirota bacterium]
MRFRFAKINENPPLSPFVKGGLNSPLSRGVRGVSPPLAKGGEGGFLKFSPDQSGGVALILVVWVIVVLIAIVGEFSYSMRTEINITRNFKEDEQAYQLALAGLEAAKAEILTAKDLTKMYADADGVIIFDREAEEAPVREADLGAGRYKYIITDEEGKLSLNTATLAQLKYIFKDSGVEGEDLDIIADSLFDWRDDNDLHLLNGAEEDYYQSLEVPYSAKDGPFDSVEELLLVKGVTPEFFYGSKGGDEEKAYGGVSKYFTAAGSGVINLNTAPKVVLEAVTGSAAAENIIMQREKGPVTAPAAGGKLSSDVFTIVSTGSNQDGTIKRSIKATLRKKENKLETLYWSDNVI